MGAFQGDTIYLAAAILVLLKSFRLLFGDVPWVLDVEAAL